MSSDTITLIFQKFGNVGLYFIIFIFFCTKLNDIFDFLAKLFQLRDKNLENLKKYLSDDTLRNKDVLSIYYNELLFLKSTGFRLTDGQLRECLHIYNMLDKKVSLVDIFKCKERLFIYEDKIKVWNFESSNRHLLFAFFDIVLIFWLCYVLLDIEHRLVLLSSYNLFITIFFLLILLFCFIFIIFQLHNDLIKGYYFTKKLEHFEAQIPYERRY